MNSVWHPAAGWYPDPGELHECRWWEGTQWTDTISDGGVAANDPLDDAVAAAQLPPGPPPPPVPSGGADWTPGAAWYPDPGGVHDWRWWDGERWASTISDGGVVAKDELESPVASAQFPPGPLWSPAQSGWGPQPQPVSMKASTTEVWRFVLYLTLLVFVPIVVGSLMGSLVPGWGLFFGLLPFWPCVNNMAGWVGYRRRDTWMFFIPFFNVYLLVVFAWRFACRSHPYWSAA